MNQGRWNAQWTARICFIAAFVFWAATILPSTSIKGWFYLDDPTQVVAAMHGGWIAEPNLMMGRHLPVFEGYRKLVYTLVGNSPAGFYFCQSLLFLGVLLLAVGLARRVAGRSALPQALAVLGLMSYSLAEPAYTLGKHEPVLVLLFMLYLGALARLDADPEPGARPGNRWATALACFLLCALAMWDKETTPALVIVLVPFLVLPSESLALRLRRFGPALVASVAGIGMAKVPLWMARRAAPVSSGEVYASFRPTLATITENGRYYLAQIPDYFVVIGLAFVLLVVGFWRFRSTREYRFAAGLALASAGYLAGLLLWRWGSVYYSYPPQWLAALACIFGFAALLKGSLWQRRLAGGACGVFVAAKLAAVVPFLYVSNAQRIEAQIYSRAVEVFASQPDVKSRDGDVRLFVENWSLISEQPVQTELYVGEILGIKARVLGASEFVTGVAPDRASAAALFHMEDIAPSDERIRPRVGDYVLTFGERFPGRYNSRAVSPNVYREPRFASATRIQWRMISSFARQVKCPASLAGLFHIKPIGSRYELHRIESVAGAGVWTGRWSDGWVGENAAFFPFSESDVPARLRVSALQEAAPNQLAVSVGNAVRQRLPIGPEPVELTMPMGSPVELHFDKAASPGKDTRRISARVEWVAASVR